MLKNKEGIWMSAEEWSFKAKDEKMVLMYVENISNEEVLGTTSDGQVVLEDFEENKAEQLWKFGKLKAGGYFTIENSKELKALTATSLGSLEIKGKITMR